MLKLVGIVSLFLALSCQENTVATEENAFIEANPESALKFADLKILPPDIELEAGRVLPVRAFGLLPYDRRLDLTDAGTFSLDDPSLLVLDAAAEKPKIIAKKPGEGKLQFTYEGRSTIANVRIQEPSIEDALLLPARQSVKLELYLGEAQSVPVRWQILGVFGDGTTGDLSAMAQWSVNPPDALEKTDSPGSYILKKAGQATISAVFREETLTAELQATVNPKSLSKILSLPAQLIVAKDTARTIRLEKFYSDQSREAWANPQIKHVTPAELARVTSNPDGSLEVQALSLGSGSITVSSEGQDYAVPLLIAEATADTLSLQSDSNFQIAKGDKIKIKAMLTYADGIQEDVTSRSTFTLASPNFLSVQEGEKGYYQATRAGEVLVTASYGSFQGSQKVTIAAPRPTSLQISSAANGSLGLYLERDFAATASLSDGTSADVTAQTTWIVIAGTGRADTHATIRGRISGQQTGNVRVRGTYNGLSAELDLTVGTVVPVSLSLVSSWSGLSLGGGGQAMQAMVTLSDGTMIDKTQDVTWDYIIVGSGLSFAGYVRNDSGFKGMCYPLATGFFRVKASLGDISAEKSVQVNL